MNEILIASGNKHKLKELQSVAARFDIRLIPPDECRQSLGLAPCPEVEENGTTFFENALLKAQAFSAWSGMPALGDDSGLEVEALEGRPGIFSARYASDDSARIDKLLRELEALEQRSGQSNRRARFRSVLVLFFPRTGEILHAEGTLEGEVLRERRGHGGFGYDPIIYLEALQATLAEIDFARTCREGFRALAAEKLFARLQTRAKTA